MNSTEAAAVNMRALRRAAGLTQEQLGERIGWTKIAVSAAERSVAGKRPRAFALRDVDLIAGALGVTPMELITPPAPCSCCGDNPPAGMICQQCGAKGASRASS